MKSQRPWQADDDEAVTSIRHLQRYSEEEEPIQRGDTIRSSRRAKSESDRSYKQVLLEIKNFFFSTAKTFGSST